MSQEEQRKQLNQTEAFWQHEVDKLVVNSNLPAEYRHATMQAISNLNKVMFIKGRLAA